jgi:DNA modification methylase
MRATEDASPSPCYVTPTGLGQVFLDDCLDWLERQPRQSIHAVLTDPPYGMLEYSPGQIRKLRAGRGGVWRIPPSIGGSKRAPLPRFTVLQERDFKALYEFFLGFGKRLLPALVPGGHVAIASSPLLSHNVSQALVDAGFEKRGEIVRLVRTLRGGDRPKGAEREYESVSMMPRSTWEPWILVRRPLEGTALQNLQRWQAGGLRRPSTDEPFCDVIPSGRTPRQEKLIAPHPSLKPQAFLRQLARALLPLGKGVILDPFAGAGSTIAACEALGIESIGVEIDPVYVEMAQLAIPRLTGLSCESASVLAVHTWDPDKLVSE